MYDVFDQPLLQELHLRLTRNLRIHGDGEDEFIILTAVKVKLRFPKLRYHVNVNESIVNALPDVQWWKSSKCQLAGISTTSEVLNLDIGLIQSSAFICLARNHTSVTAEPDNMDSALHAHTSAFSARSFA